MHGCRGDTLLEPPSNGTGRPPHVRESESESREVRKALEETGSDYKSRLPIAHYIRSVIAPKE